MGPGLYIHIPLCISKCPYCDFGSVGYEPRLAERYVDALLAEMRRAPSIETPATLYIGGGTPSILTISQLESIINSALQRFGIEDGAEITLEANPGALDSEKARALAAIGVTRLSLGVQSLDESVLKTLGRAHDAAAAIEASALVRSAGLSLSIDLIYAVPGQSSDSWNETLERAIGLGPEHVSAYELTPEKGTPLYAWLEEGRLSLPSEDIAVAMFRHAQSRLGSAGFEHYEVSNYSRPGRRSRHNTNYWERGQYIGLGAAAHSFYDETRSANLRDPGAYIEAIKRGQSAVAESQSVTPDEARREFLFLGLRMMEGISIKEAREGYGIENIEEKTAGLVRDGIFEIEAGRLRVSERAVPVMNAAVVALMRALGV